MSEAKISELDKRLSMQEANVNRVLEAVEKQASSTDRLNDSVVQMTARFDFLTQEVKDLKSDVKEAKKVASTNETEIAVIKRGNKWQEWAERGVVAAIIAAIIFAMKQS